MFAEVKTQNPFLNSDCRYSLNYDVERAAFMNELRVALQASALPAQKFPLTNCTTAAQPILQEVCRGMARWP